MTKLKYKTQVSAYVGRKLGEWLRDKAHKERRSQGEIIREALKTYRRIEESE